MDKDKDLDRGQAENKKEIISDQNNPQSGSQHKIVHLSGMYKEWFLDYASYVILERAVPHIDDGLKPVQRRILHSMKRLDDGRYNKVANLIGHTMQFHPHGDASIGDALVQLGQKDLLIDTQGNWGNIHTGDSAAAPRYIEARLSKFANDVVFNPKTTEWKATYDGRNKEPITLPVKFPLLLAQGVEGIAVGLASKVLPHNFVELIDASIAHLKGEEFELFPDFPTGGLIDVSKYNDGLRGGNVKVRSRIEKIDNKTLVIREIPFGKTTSGLIESVLKANEKGKIKIKKIDDNTAENVEIMVYLATGVSSDKTIDALYAFTDCEVSISPNSCTIEQEHPRFLGVTEILKITANRTVDLLRLELEIRKAELEEGWHFASLEKIFIEKRIYRKIEECETFEAIIETIDKGLKPYKKLLRREVTRDDIIRLTEIKIKRISRYDSFKADDQIKAIEAEIDEVNYNLENIIPYTIKYFERIKAKYGEGRERKTEIRNFDTIVATKVVVANEKFYVNRKEGFIGTGLKKEEFVSECSDIDDIIVFRRDGKYLITKVDDKSFVGKDIIHAAVFKPNDARTIYNVIYKDGRYGAFMMKRFFVKGITRDKEYDITKGTDGSRIAYFTANPNGEAEVIRVVLKPKSKLRRLSFEQDFGELAIKGRGSNGNILTKHDVHRISLKEKGLSTLGGRKIWFDEDVHRLNGEERGKYLGEFMPEDKILVVSNEGYYRVTSFELSNHYTNNINRIEKLDPDKVFTAVHFDGEQGFYYLKRFQVEESDKKMFFINEEHADSKLILISDDELPMLEVTFGGKHKDRPSEQIDANEFIAVKGFKARGKRITTFETESFTWLESPQNEEPEELIEQDETDNDQEVKESATNDAEKEAPKEEMLEPKANENVKAVKEKTAAKEKTKEKKKEPQEQQFDDIEFEIEDTRNKDNGNEKSEKKKQTKSKRKPKTTSKDKKQEKPATGKKQDNSGQMTLDL
jgi:topoisomerase-4 subunit A